MARKRPVLARVLGARSVAAVAYGEIGSSLFIALGIVAFLAGGLLPWVLLGVGAIFLLVALSYAEGVTAIPETGGGPMLVRRAFNDPAGFFTGWLLLLDYIVVIALAGLFVPHYIGTTAGWESLESEPWDGIIGVLVILGVAGSRLVRRSQLYLVAQLVAGLAFLTQLVLIIVGFAVVFDPSDIGAGVDLGTNPSWHDVAFALAVATLAYTGLETVSNFAAETTEPGRALPRSLFGAVGAVVGMAFLLGMIGLSVPELGGSGRDAPLEAIVDAARGSLPGWLGDALAVFVMASAVIVLVSAITTSISGVGRLTHALGRHGMLPRRFARLSPRTLIAPAAIVCAAVLSSALLILADIAGRELSFLASLYSFGVLLAFVAAQLAVLRLRATEPDLERPFRAPLNVRIRGVELPLPALVGVPLAFGLWIAAVVTHGAAQIAGPLWLATGAVVYVVVRRFEQEGLMESVHPAEADLVPETEGVYANILVPLKIGPIGEEVLATAVRLAEERSSTVSVLYVLRVPLDRPLDAELPDEERRAAESIAEIDALAAEHKLTIDASIVRARALGEAIVEEANRRGADLIVMGSAPRWRRQSRFFSPTVDYVLRKASCEVMVVVYPRGVLDDTKVET
jgi:basic amino acid/polyamine antiporter, APA family